MVFHDPRQFTVGRVFLVDDPSRDIDAPHQGIEGVDGITAVGSVGPASDTISRPGDRRPGLGEFSGDPADRIGADARNPGNPLHAVMRHRQLPELRKTGRPTLDKSGVVESFADDDIGHCQRKGAVRPRLDRDPFIRLAGGEGEARIDNHDLGPVRPFPADFPPHPQIAGERVLRFQDAGAEGQEIVGGGKVVGDFQVVSVGHPSPRLLRLVCQGRSGNQVGGSVSRGEAGDQIQVAGGIQPVQEQ